MIKKRTCDIESLVQVSVFSKDLREAAEVGSGTNIIGNMSFMISFSSSKLCPLRICFLSPHVISSPQTVGVINKTEWDDGSLSNSVEGTVVSS